MSEVIDREDAYLATMAQEYSDVLPEPVTRKDRYLVKIIDILAQTSGITREEVRQMINDAISKIDQLTRKIVASVNDIDVTAADADQYLYMVPVNNPEAGNNYDEYIVVNQTVEHIGDTTMDLSEYVKSSELTTALLDYVKDTELTTALQSYVKSSDLTTALQSYVTNSGLASELQNYITVSGLATELQNYVTSSGLATELQGYVKNTTYASTLKTGVMKVSSTYGVTVDSTNGQLNALTKTNSEYKSANNRLFVSKGTLENLKETWTLTLEDGTEVTKNVFISPV